MNRAQRRQQPPLPGNVGIPNQPAPFAMCKLANGGEVLVLWAHVSAVVSQGLLLDGPNKDQPAIAIVMGPKTFQITGNYEKTIEAFVANGAIKLRNRAKDGDIAVAMGHVGILGDEAAGAVMITVGGPEIRSGNTAAEIMQIMSRPKLWGGS